ncbi:MAG: hypothetical protein PW792_01010 [Acidobacteriaceae bacterium]|nr:hypothetical protein [Acidobacteriaceae bacterium]
MIAELRLDSSKLWWGYLGVRSNPELSEGPGTAIFFDSLERVPTDRRDQPDTRFYFIFWDGVQTEAPLQQAQRQLGEAAELVALFVGSSDLPAGSRFRPQPLYPRGVLHFSKPDSEFDTAARQRISKLKVRQRLMPLKNLLQANVNRKAGLDLLLGRERLVFCGVFLFSEALLEQFCGYHGVAPSLIRGRALFEEDADRSWDSFLRYLDRDGRYYAGLLDSGDAPLPFFRRIIRVMIRSYFILRLESEGARMFTNGWTSGSNINVYTTPFYQQHRFLDFGSVAGSGNYPRLSDLAYFRKKTVCVDDLDEHPDIVQAARDGRLEVLFSEAYERLAPSMRVPQ